MLPMVVTTAQREVLLAPDDLRARPQPAAGQTGGDHLTAQRAGPHVSDIARKQRIGFAPIGAIIVEHRSPRQPASAKLAACPPRRIVFDPVRRIGDHQEQLGSGHHWRHRHRVGAVAAANPVVSQQPDVTRSSDRLLGNIGNAVGIA